MSNIKADEEYAKKFQITECPLCATDFVAEERMLTHTLVDSHNCLMKCAECEKVCTDCALHTLRTMCGKCPFTKQVVQFKPATMDVLEILMDNLNINVIAEEEDNFDFQNEEEDINDQFDFEEEDINDQFDFEEEDINVQFDFQNEEEDINDQFDFEEVNWQRRFPCNKHFDANGVVKANGGCTDITCPFSHQQIRCRFADNCRRRSTCLYKH